MTTTEQLMERIFDTAIDGAIEANVSFSAVLEALKMTLDEAACLAADELDVNDPAVDARIEDISRAITSLQEEITGCQ